MKKRLLLLTILVYSSFIVAQKTDWIFSLQSNIIKVDIEDDLDADYSGGLSSSFPDPNNITTFHINRKTQTKVGFEIGAKARYKIFDQFYLMSGIDIVQYRFYRIEWIENHSDATSNLAPPFFPDVLRFSSIGIPTIDILTTTHFDGGFKKENPLVNSQGLTLLKFPFNLGFSNRSDKVFLYGGFWYSRVVGFKYHNSKNYDWDIGKLINRNGLGINAGFQIAVFKKWNLKIDYSNSPSNIYAEKYKLAGSIEGDFPKSKNTNTISFGVAYKL